MLIVIYKYLTIIALDMSSSYKVIKQFSLFGTYRVQTRNMEALKLNELSVNKIKLEVPRLENIVEVLGRELKKNFARVEVGVVDCPDLSASPFNLAAKGLCGNPSVVQVGDPSYVVPVTRTDKIYDFRDVPKTLGLETSFIIGAGGGCWPTIGHFCEMCANVTVKDNNIQNYTKEVFSKDKTLDGITVEDAEVGETKFSVLGNLFASRGEPGKVLRVSCKQRISKEDFPSAIKNALHSSFAHPIALGVIFTMKNGKAEHHVAPEFVTKPLNSTEELMKWFLLPIIEAPFISLGTILTSNPDDWDVQAIHFHSFKGTETGGHYHFDTTPEEAEYEAFMLPAETLCAIDRSTSAISIFNYEVK